MKKIFSFLLVALVFAACGGGDAAKGDKKTQLAELKKQQAALASQIATLEKELAIANPSQKDNSKFVTVEPITPSVFTNYIELQGAVSADDQVYAAPKAAGALTNVYIKVGDRVNAGQVIATVDDEILVQSMEEVRKRWELANDVYEKQEALWKQGIGAEVQYLGAKNNKEALDKTLATLNKQRELYQIKAPISGVVDECGMKVGLIVGLGNPMIGLNQPLAKIVNFSKLKVEVNAPETYAGKLRVGNSVVVQMPDLQKEFSSKIGYVGAGVNPANRTFRVDIPMKGNEKGVLPNMATVVKVINYSNAGAMVVPINLIQKDLGNNDYVMIENAGKAQKVMIKMGQTYADKAEIVSGLKSGDKLITVGYQDLNDGDAVKIN